ncbi:hypothetical protein BDN70DRAFT_901581 [Pholiota conissans]|uniref:Uncharacterized protein n=1 Tax=Pholiota conissans TaxID=109636 RepID=A0A9P5YKV2_9AGAR|nr:hypothetical protein BDN70DRAFT_901581 [Pholiota conissans]
MVWEELCRHNCYYIQNIETVLSLTNELVLVQCNSACFAIPGNAHTKQELCWIKISAFEVQRELLYSLVNCNSVLGSEGNIIDVDGNKDAHIAIGVDVHRAVCFNVFKAHFSESSMQLDVPLTRRLFEAIERFPEPAHHVGTAFMETFRLYHVDVFIKVTIGKSSRNINRMKL